MTFEPMSREKLIANGRCCQYGCLNCPYGYEINYIKPKRPPFQIDTRIADALKSGEIVTIHSDRPSLVAEITLQNRVTIIYKAYRSLTS